MAYPFSQNILCVCAMSCQGYATRILPREVRIIFQPRGPKPFNLRMTQGSHMRQKLASRITVHFVPHGSKQAARSYFPFSIPVLHSTGHSTTCDTCRREYIGSSHEIVRIYRLWTRAAPPTAANTLNDIARSNKPHRPTSH